MPTEVAEEAVSYDVRERVAAADDANERQLRALSARLLPEVLASRDATGRLAAFAETRSPQWQGQ